MDFCDLWHRLSAARRFDLQLRVLCVTDLFTFLDCHQPSTHNTSLVNLTGPKNLMISQELPKRLSELIFNSHKTFITTSTIFFFLLLQSSINFSFHKHKENIFRLVVVRAILKTTRVNSKQTNKLLRVSHVEEFIYSSL